MQKKKDAKFFHSRLALSAPEDWHARLDTQRRGVACREGFPKVLDVAHVSGMFGPSLRGNKSTSVGSESCYWF